MFFGIKIKQWCKNLLITNKEILKGKLYLNVRSLLESTEDGDIDKARAVIPPTNT